MQNSYAECLGQTIYKIAFQMLKDCRLDVRFWPKLVSTANYFCNWELVTSQSITFYRINPYQKAKLSSLCQISQYSYI